MKARSLSQQILIYMATVTLVTVAVVFIGSFYGYDLLLDLYPFLDTDDPLPTTIDWLVLSGPALFSMIIAWFIAMKLASRLLIPIDSLAASVRRIAGGDLTARAAAGHMPLGEAAQLINDFNIMAQRLQDMSEGVAAWNAAIAHELRTPITILKGKLQGVLDGVLPIDERFVEKLLLQTDALARVVDDLRVVTLGESGRLDLLIEPLNLESEVRKVVEAMGPSLSDAGFNVQLIVIDLIAHVDAVRLRQAITALLENVRRYANPGYVEVALLRSGDDVVLRVEDSGPGLPLSFLKAAFDPFSRADESRSRQKGGSGLGLAVVRAIAIAHGGELKYRKTSRGGAAFEIVLPFSRTLPTKADTAGVRFFRQGKTSLDRP